MWHLIEKKEGIFEAKRQFHFSSFLWHLLKVFISQSRITSHRGKTTNLSVSPKTWASAFESIEKVRRNEFYKCSVGRDQFQITNDKFFHSTDIKINCCPTDVEIGNRNTRFYLHQYGFFDCLFAAFEYVLLLHSETTVSTELVDSKFYVSLRIPSHPLTHYRFHDTKIDDRTRVMKAAFSVYI